MDRESALRAEETRRLAHFESRSREAADDIHRHRHRVDVEILEARYDMACSVNYNLSSVRLLRLSTPLRFSFLCNVLSSSTVSKSSLFSCYLHYVNPPLALFMHP